MRRASRVRASPGRWLACAWMGLHLVQADRAQAAPEGRQAPQSPQRIVWVQAELQRPDSLIEFVRKRTPGVVHDVIVANSLRTWRMVEQGQEVCRVATMRTPSREAKAYFTNTMLHPRVEILVREDLARSMPTDASGAVDLARVLRGNPAWRGAYSLGRSYGDLIDNILAEAKGNPALAGYAMADYGSRLLEMLAKDRFDYLIEFQGALEFMRRRGLEAERFVSLPLMGATQAVIGGVACPRTPWGLAAVRVIDRVLGTPEGAAFLRKDGSDWLGPEAVQRLGESYDQFFKERAKPSISAG